jgi:hypothetical protein
MTKRNPLGVWRCVLAAASLVLPAAILADPPAAGPTAQDIDQNVQKLKQQSLDIEQQALAAQSEFLHPAQTRVNIYVGVLIPGMLIKDITVSIDGGTPVHHAYTDAEAVALQDGGLNLLTQVRAESGSTHRVHAEFTAQYTDAKLGDAPFIGSYDGSFDKTDQPADIELALLRMGYLSPPELKLKDWRPAS